MIFLLNTWITFVQFFTHFSRIKKIKIEKRRDTSSNNM